MRDFGVGRPLPAVGVLVEVGDQTAGALRAAQDVRDPFALNCDLVLPADHQCDPLERLEVRVLAGADRGVENQFSLVGGRDADQRRFGRTVRAPGGDHGQPALAHERHQLAQVHGTSKPCR